MNGNDTVASQSVVASMEVRATLADLQSENLLLVYPVLYVLAFVLIACAKQFPDPLQAGLPAVILFLLPVCVWGLRKVHYLASAWALVLGCLAMVLLFVLWVGIGATLQLLALPVALAAIFISLPGGTVAAIACTLLLFFMPPGSLTPDRAHLISTLIGIWGMLGLIWLSRRPLLTAMHWSWTSYAQGRSLLERARDTQVRLKQTLEDLADANLQLTRLNNLTQALRHVAEDARKAKEQFVANVSHELRTPLNMIVGFSEMILQSPDVYGSHLSSKLLADLDVILRNSRHLSRLIDDVLDLSQVEAGQMALSKERVALGEIIEAALVAVRPLFDSKSLWLDAEVAEDLPDVLCDATRIRQVVLNLLSNAGRFTERGGVWVRAWREEEGYVTVSVADTGPGIASDARDELFRPFQQVDGSIRRRYGGSGLGLSISKSFVELHGGRIWFQSEEGVGTTFFFRLPIDPPPPLHMGASRWLSPYEERTRPSLAPAPVVRPRFVVLESDCTLGRLLARYLDEVEIASAEDLEGALQELTQRPAQALIVNDASADGALRALIETSALPYGVPVMICSLPSVSEAANELGVADYLVKPVARDVLLATLDRLDLQDKTLLIVDDEEDALRLFRRMLLSAGRGYRVVTATDGEEALRVLREQRPDVLLLDLVMPNMDGFRLLAEKSQDPALHDVPVVVISARDPAGQPIVSHALMITQRDGLSASQLLGCITKISAALSPTMRTADLGPQGTRSDQPAWG